MRNLKRALSLTLASVMLLGMMVVGAGAAAFPDVEENHNVEAIEVLKAVNVMIGDDNGNFGPDDPVNRAQMAVVMANLLNLDYNYYEGQSTFKDVPSWAVPYVAACYANGIVSGYNSYTYGSGDGVTAVQAASMMMRALGYFKYTEDYKDGFELVTVRQGTEIGIFDGIDAKSDAGLTRNQVARMALNALESEMVSFTGTPGTTYTASNGETLSIGYVAKYEPRTSTELKYTAIEQRTSDVSGGNNLNRGQYYIQLGEELYNGKLVKKYARDDFERPSINWQYNGKEIGTYVDYDLLVAGGTYTDEVKGSVLYDLLTYTTIRDNDLLSYVDGVQNDIKKEDLVRSNKNEVKGSGLGVLTEVFFDQERDEIIITSINTYLAKANSDYNKNNESLSLKVYTGAGSGKVASTTQVVDSAVVPNAADVKKDDFVLVYMSGKENANSLNNYPNYSVVKLFDVEVMSDSSVTKFSTSTSKVVDKLTTGGTEYKANVKAFYDFGNALETYDAQLLTNMTYNIFMDRYNNVIGVELEEGTKNYVFITGYDRVDSHISTKTAQAAAIFMDGTMDEITVNVTETNKKIKSVMDKNANYVEWGSNRTNDAEDAKNGVRDLNRWYTYTVNNNGTYTLKPVDHFMYSSAKETGITTAANKDLGTIDAANTKTLNSANLYLDDSRPTNANNRTYTNEGRAYGNDDTVYITVEPGTVDWSANGGHTKDAITDVKGVYKGIQNVKIELKPEYKESVNDRKGNGLSASYDESEKNAYVYSVFDSNYYIIASVVLGEAQGAAANYAYILGDVKSERVEFEGSSKSSGDATYYWEFDAFYKGEKVTLTAKTKYPGKESDLTKFHVQELRFDGDYVTSVKDVADSRVMSVNNSYDEANDKFFPTDVAKIDGHNVYDVGHVDTATAALVGGDYQVHTHTGTHDINNEYGYSDHRLNGTIELVGRTLYTEREKYGVDNYDVGLALRSNDTPALLIQPENGKVETTVCSSVSEAIGRLADADNDGTNGKQFKGRIVAALKDNIADWVVIISDTNLTTGKDPDYGSNTRYLDLYDDLGNSNLENPTTVTASNRKGDDRVIKGYIYRDTNDVVCTRYTIPVGYTTVVIQDQDIDAGTRFANGTYYINPTTMDEVINLRNNTITIAEMDRNVKISSESSIYDDNKAVVEITGVKNIVTVSPSSNWKIGDVITITNSDPANYSYKVTGATGTNGKYTIEAKNVTIHVEELKKDDIKVEVNDTHGWPIYAIEEKTDGIVTTVKAGQKIKTDPEEAVEFTAGVSDTPDANGYYTVLDGAEKVEISVKTGWRYAATKYMWSGPNGAIDVNFYGDLEAKGMMARAATMPGADETVIEKDPLWLVKSIRAARKSTNCVVMQDGENGWYIGTAARPWFILPLGNTTDDFFASSEETVARVGTGWSGELDMKVDVDSKGQITAADVISKLGDPLPGTVPATEIELTDSATGEVTATATIVTENGTADITVKPVEGNKFVPGVSVVDNKQITAEDIAADGSISGKTDVEEPAEKFNVTVNVDEADRVTVTGAGEYAEGAKAEIKVEAKDGFVIATVNGEPVEEAMQKVWTAVIESVTANVTYTITTAEEEETEQPSAGKVFLTVNAPEGYTVKVDNTVYNGKTEVAQKSDVTLTISTRTRGEKITVTGAEADKTVRGQYKLTTATENVTVDIKAEKAAGPFTLTVNQIGAESKVTKIAAQGAVDTGKVFWQAASSGVAEIKDVTVTNTVNGDVIRETSDVYAGETITILSGNALAAGTYEIDGVAVTVKEQPSKADDAKMVTFTMPEKNFGLGVTSNNVVSLDGVAVSEVVSITAHDGVTADWTSASANKSGTISGTAPVSVPKDAVITITSNGTGTAVLAAKKDAKKFVAIEGEAAPAGIYDANASSTAGKEFDAVTTSGNNETVITDLYSVRKVTLSKDAKSVEGKIGEDSVVSTVPAQRDTANAETPKDKAAYVSVSEEITFAAKSTKAAEKYTAFTTSEIADTKLANNKLPAGGEDVTVYGAFQVTVGEGMNIKAGTTALTGTKYIVPAETRTLKGSVAAGAGTNVVSTMTGNAKYTLKTDTVDAVLSSTAGMAVDKDIALTAVTKLTLTNANARYGATDETKLLSTTGNGTLIYVKKGVELFLVSGDNTSALEVKVGNAEAVTLENGDKITMTGEAVEVKGGASTGNIVIDEIYVIQDEASWNKLPDAIRTSWGTNQSWTDLNNEKNSNNLPWLAFHAKKGAGMPAEAVTLGVTVTTPNGTYTMKNGTGTTWTLKAGAETEGWYSFEMTGKTGERENIDRIELADKDLVNGTYSVDVTWKGTEKSGSAAATVDYTKSTEAMTKKVIKITSSMQKDDFKKNAHGAVGVGDIPNSWSLSAYQGAHLCIVYDKDTTLDTSIRIVDANNTVVFYEKFDGTPASREVENKGFFYISLLGGNSKQGTKEGTWVGQTADNSDKLGEKAKAGDYTYTLTVGDWVTTGYFTLSEDDVKDTTAGGSTGGSNDNAQTPSTGGNEQQNNAPDAKEESNVNEPETETTEPETEVNDAGTNENNVEDGVTEGEEPVA